MKNILFFIMGLLIVILSVCGIFKYNEQYKNTEKITATIYNIHPYILYYFVIIGIQISVIGFLALKNNGKSHIAPIVVHIAIPLMTSIMYWAIYINEENKRTMFFPSLIMFCFMTVHIFLLQSNIYTRKRK